MTTSRLPSRARTSRRGGSRATIVQSAARMLSLYFADFPACRQSDRQTDGHIYCSVWVSSAWSAGERRSCFPAVVQTDERRRLESLSGWRTSHQSQNWSSRWVDAESVRLQRGCRGRESNARYTVCQINPWQVLIDAYINVRAVATAVKHKTDVKDIPWKTTSREATETILLSDQSDRLFICLV